MPPPLTGAAPPAAARAEVLRVSLERDELTAEDVPELFEVFGLRRLPLAETRVAVELGGVPTAVANALRRTLVDEMPGHALQVPAPPSAAGGFDAELTTDKHILPQYLNNRIALLRLRAAIPAEVADSLEFDLDVANPSAEVRDVFAGDLTVVAGAMPEPLFNPTAVLCALQPGRRVVVRGIRVAAGYGRDHAAFNVACRAAFTHLDLPQFGDAETREDGDPADARAAFDSLCDPAAAAAFAAAGERRGCAADLSGYRLSCLVADPRRHLLRAVLPATGPDPAEARAVLADACAEIKKRLQLVAAAVAASGCAEGQGQKRLQPAAADREPPGGPRGMRRGAAFSVVVLDAAGAGSGLAEGTLDVPNETDTIGELLRRTIFDLTPSTELASVDYEVIGHENRLRLRVRLAADAAGVAAVVAGAVRHAIATFDAIRQGILAAR